MDSRLSAIMGIPTGKPDEFHFVAIESLLGDALADRKDDLWLVLLLLKDGDAVLEAHGAV